MGTQTSKPLHGDEERRVRFRRPRTPVNNSNNLVGEGPIDNSNNNNINSNSNSRTWPCANCHATVSNQESRCPYCGGIQVKIPQSPSSTSKAMNSNLLLERLAATPTTPVTRRQIDPNKIHAFLSESATTSTMSYDDEDDVVVDEDVVEADSTSTSHIVVSSQPPPALLQAPQPPLQEQPERPASALSQSSTLSQNFNLPLRRLPSPAMFSSSARSAASPAPSIDSIPAGARTTPTMSLYHNHNSVERPPDPVALTLEAAVQQYQQQQQLRSGTPSPQFILEQQQQQAAAVAAKRKTSSRGGDEINTDGFEVPKKKMVLPPSS